MNGENENKSRFVVSADWLEQRLDDPSVKIIDAAWYLPAQNRDAKAEYAAAHIPGAVFFDQDAIADRTSALPHTLPSPEAFSEAVGAMGISENDTIVVYDGPGIFTSPRVWWMFRIMGAENVFVLDGGMDGWKADGRPTTTEVAKPSPQAFNAVFNPNAVTSFERMRMWSSTGSPRLPMRAAPGASPARNRSRGRACGRAICRVQGACPRAYSPTRAGSRISMRCAELLRMPASI